MSDEKPLSEWARKRAAGKARRVKEIERRETYFDLLVSGYSVEQIAGATKMSAAAVRRAIDQTLAERRLDAPENFARLQIARLTKALRCADVSLEEGNFKAISPFLQVMGELNRFYGVAAAGPMRVESSGAAPDRSIGSAPALALPRAAEALEGACAENPESCVGEVLTS